MNEEWGGRQSELYRITLRYVLVRKALPYAALVACFKVMIHVVGELGRWNGEHWGLNRGRGFRFTAEVNRAFPLRPNGLLPIDGWCCYLIRRSWWPWREATDSEVFWGMGVRG